MQFVHGDGSLSFDGSGVRNEMFVLRMVQIFCVGKDNSVVNMSIKVRPVCQDNITAY